MRKRHFDDRKGRKDRSGFGRHDRPKARPDSSPDRAHRGARGEHDRARPDEGAEPRGRRDKSRQERPARKKPWRAPPRDRDGPVILYGWHSVKAALENPARRFHRLLATENAIHRLAETGIAL